MDDANEPMDAQTVGLMVQTFFAALAVVGKANEQWDKNKTRQTAHDIDTALANLVTATEAVATVVPQLAAITRDQLSAWYAENPVVEGGVSRLSLPPQDWQ